MKEQEKEKGTECGEKKRQKKSWRARFIEDERSREERGRKVGEHASQKMKDQGREKLEIDIRAYFTEVRERERQKIWRAHFTEVKLKRVREKEAEKSKSICLTEDERARERERHRVREKKKGRNVSQ